MDRADRDEAHEVAQEFVVSGCDTAEVFEFIEQPLDGITFLVEVPVTGIGRRLLWRGEMTGIAPA